MLGRYLALVWSLNAMGLDGIGESPCLHRLQAVHAEAFSLFANRADVVHVLYSSPGIERI